MSKKNILVGLAIFLAVLGLLYILVGQQIPEQLYAGKGHAQQLAQQFCTDVVSGKLQDAYSLSYSEIRRDNSLVTLVTFKKTIQIVYSKSKSRLKSCSIQSLEHIESSTEEGWYDGYEVGIIYTDASNQTFSDSIGVSLFRTSLISVGWKVDGITSLT